MCFYFKTIKLCNSANLNRWVGNMTPFPEGPSLVRSLCQHNLCHRLPHSNDKGWYDINDDLFKSLVVDCSCIYIFIFYFAMNVQKPREFEINYNFSGQISNLRPRLSGFVCLGLKLFHWFFSSQFCFLILNNDMILLPLSMKMAKSNHCIKMTIPHSLDLKMYPASI